MNAAHLILLYNYKNLGYRTKILIGTNSSISLDQQPSTPVIRAIHN